MDAIAEMFTIQKVNPSGPEDVWADLPVNLAPEMASLITAYI